MICDCARVHLGFMHEFLNTSCVTNLAFLTEAEDSPDCMLLIIIIIYMSSLVFLPAALC